MGLAADRKDEQGEAPSAETIPLGIAARVSSRKQARKSGENATGSSLDHQIDRLESFVRDKWGPEPLKRAHKYYGQGSGLNFERPELLQLVRDILEGRLKGGYVVAYDQTRIVRFGIKLIEYLCKIGGCKIVYVMKEGKDEESFAETLAEDVLSIMTFYGNKFSGMKAARVTRIETSEDDLARIWELHCQGYGIKVIVETLAEEGRKSPNKGKPYTRHVVETAIKKQGEVLEETLGRVPTRFEEFASVHIDKTGDENDILEYGEAEKAYLAWETQIPVTNPVIKAGMLAMELEQKRVKRQGIERKVYVGVRLV